MNAVCCCQFHGGSGSLSISGMAAVAPNKLGRDYAAGIEIDQVLKLEQMTESDQPFKSILMTCFGNGTPS